MGLKRGKYIYVELDKKKYVKVRVFRGRKEGSPDRYAVVGPIVKKPPFTATVVRLIELPPEVGEKIIAEVSKF
jgi:hypothetical protein